MAYFCAVNVTLKNPSSAAIINLCVNELKQMEFSINSGRKTIFNQSFISHSSLSPLLLLLSHQLFRASLLVIKSDFSTISNHQSRLSGQTLKSVSRAIIATLLRLIRLHSRVLEAHSSPLHPRSPSCLLHSITSAPGPSLPKATTYTAKIYTYPSPPPLYRLHWGVILFYSCIHLPLSYPVTSESIMLVQ